MTTYISAAGLMAIYHDLGTPADGEKVAVKISTGENGRYHMIRKVIPIVCAGLAAVNMTGCHAYTNEADMALEQTSTEAVVRRRWTFR